MPSSIFLGKMVCEKIQPLPPTRSIANACLDHNMTGLAFIVTTCASLAAEGSCPGPQLRPPCMSASSCPHVIFSIHFLQMYSKTGLSLKRLHDGPDGTEKEI